MSRESEKLFSGVTRIDDEIIEQAQAAPKRHRRLYRRWMGPVAAILALALLVSGLFGSRLISSVYAVEQAVYPKYDTRSSFVPDEGARAFVRASLPVFLGGRAGENRIYSPLNTYMALAMTAELTAGESRGQIMAVLGETDLDTLRGQARELWKQNYRDDQGGKSLSAASLWMDDAIRYERDALKVLAENYYASSFSGKLGSPGMDRALQIWLNDQTGGMLADKASAESTHRSGTEADVLTLASTVYFTGKWNDKFEKSDTYPQVFHAPGGDITGDFMHQQRLKGIYYWFDSFAVVPQSFTSNAVMWYILPDEGVTPEELLQDPQLLAFLTSEDRSGDYRDNSKYIFVNLAVPKFDVSAEVEMTEGLRAMGITDIFDRNVSDFTPLTRDEVMEEMGVWLSQAKQASRVLIDEQGCEAATYIKFQFGAGTGGPPTDEVDFVLDRPFLFAVTNGTNGLPLFVGIVNQP